MVSNLIDERMFSLTIEKLNELLFSGKISEEIYLVLRGDLEREEITQTENTCRVPTTEVAGSNYIVPKSNH